MNESFTETSSTSWFGRIGGAIKGVFVGIILLVVAVAVLFWNEGRSVRRYKTLEEGRKIVVTVTPESVDRNREGALVHLNGLATTDEFILDPLFNISGQVLKLQRIVEMYQWKEEKKSESRKKMGGGTETKTTFSYNKVWSEKLINSNSFRQSQEHQNPPSMPYSSETFYSNSATIGAFHLTESLLDKVPAKHPLPVDTGLIPSTLGQYAQTHGSGYYVGMNHLQPTIGDIRITFHGAKPTEVTLVSKQVNDTFQPFRGKYGGTIELLKEGTFTAEEMFSKAHKENQIFTWILRAVGFVVMFIGFILILKPLSVLADVVPLFGNIVEFGTGIISFVFASAITLITIGISWFFFRPLLGGGLCLGAGFLFFKFRHIFKSKKQTPPKDFIPAKKPLSPPAHKQSKTLSSTTIPEKNTDIKFPDFPSPPLPIPRSQPTENTPSSMNANIQGNNGILNASIDSTGRTKLMDAVFRGKADVVVDLLIKGADPNIRDKRNKTALYYAKAQGFNIISQALIDAGGTE